MADSKNIYEEIDKTIEDAVKKREKQKNTLKESADKQREIIAKSNEDMLTATEIGDLKAFKNAKKMKEDALDNLELFTGRLEHLENEAYISDEDGLELVTKIHAIQSAKLDKCLEELKPLLDKIDEIGAETFAFIDQGNDLISKWSARVKPFRKVIGYNNEVPVYQESTPFYLDANEYRNYLHYITERPQYTAITSKPGYVENVSRFVI